MQGSEEIASIPMPTTPIVLAIPVKVPPSGEAVLINLAVLESPMNNVESI